MYSSKQPKNIIIKTKGESDNDFSDTTHTPKAFIDENVFFSLHFVYEIMIMSVKRKESGRKME